MNSLLFPELVMRKLQQHKLDIQLDIHWFWNQEGSKFNLARYSLILKIKLARNSTQIRYSVSLDFWLAPISTRARNIELDWNSIQARFTVFFFISSWLEFQPSSILPFFNIKLAQLGIHWVISNWLEFQNKSIFKFWIWR